MIKAQVNMIFNIQFHSCLGWYCCLLCCDLRLTGRIAWMCHAPEYEYIKCFEMIGTLN